MRGTSVTHIGGALAFAACEVGGLVLVSQGHAAGSVLMLLGLAVAVMANRSLNDRGEVAAARVAPGLAPWQYVAIVLVGAAVLVALVLTSDVSPVVIGLALSVPLIAVTVWLLLRRGE